MPKFELPRKEFFQNLKVKGAASILKKRGYLDDNITFEGIDSTPGIVLKNQGQSALAHNIGPIAFFGGPPSNLKWFTGSLLTYVLDRVYFSRAQQR